MIKDSNNIKPDYPSTPTNSDSINNSTEIAFEKYPTTPKPPAQKIKDYSLLCKML